MGFKQVMENYARDGETIAEGMDYLGALAELAGDETAAENAHDNADDVRRNAKRVAKFAGRLPDGS